jgi:hypothetical protein
MVPAVGVEVVPAQCQQLRGAQASCDEEGDGVRRVSLTAPSAQVRVPASETYADKPTPLRIFVKVNELGGPCGQAPGSVETPLTWPASAAVSHDHVCNSEWRVPSGQLWPSALSTVIVQRSPASCASPLHPLELVMCATQPPEGGHAALAVQEVWAPGAPLRFNK